MRNLLLLLLLVGFWPDHRMCRECFFAFVLDFLQFCCCFLLTAVTLATRMRACGSRYWAGQLFSGDCLSVEFLRSLILRAL